MNTAWYRFLFGIRLFSILLVLATTTQVQANSSCALSGERFQLPPQLAPQSLKGPQRAAISELKKLGLSRKVWDGITHLLKTDNGPKILMAGAEFEELTLGGQTVKAKVGGLANVMQDMIDLLPAFLKKHGGGEVGFVYMGYDGLPRGQYQTSFKITFNGKEEQLDLYEEVLENGSKIFVLDHPAFWRRTIRSKDRNLYLNDPDAPLLTAHPEWDDAYIYGLYSYGIAETHRWYGSNILHLHEHHTVLAAKLVDQEKTSVAFSMHNAGYQGVYSAKNFGHQRNFSDPRFPEGVPMGNTDSIDDLLRILGLTEDEYMELVEDNGSVNLFLLVHLIEEYNGLAGIPVSDGYAQDLKKLLKDLVAAVRREKDAPPTNSDELYIPNGGQYLGTLYGIENGMSEMKRPGVGKHPFAQAKSPEEMKDFHPVITDPEVKALWKEGLTFGDDLTTPEGIAHVHATKAKLKWALQRTLGMEEDPNRPMFTSLGRLVDQKNMGIMIENIKRIVRDGGQVVIAGDPGDDVGRENIRRLEEIIEELTPEERKHVKYLKGFMNREIGYLIQGGADFTLIPSKFEPCGLTDAESAYLGTMVLARRTGGLGKVKGGLYYDWTDNSDFAGEVQAAGELIDQAIELYKRWPEEYLAGRITSMQNNFSWDVALEKYRNIYLSIALFKITRTLGHEMSEGKIDKETALTTISFIFKLMPEEFAPFYLDFIRNRETNNLIEKELIGLFAE